MRKSNREVNGEKVFRYSIRKYHFGAASVAVAALMFFANGAVKADTLPVSPATANTEKVSAGVTDLTEGVPLEKSLETEGNKEVVAPDSVEKTSNKEDGAGSNAQGEKEIKVSDKAVLTTNQTEEINKAETNGKEKEVVTNKDKLESLLKEIDQLNLKDYTEDTVKVLQEKVAKAKEVLVNATTQKEIDLAYNALVGYKNAGLKRVPKPKRELTPKPDTINGKTTVGLKAENTEPNATNIAGHNHSLNGTTRAEGSGFRDASTETLNIEWGYGSDYSTDGSYHRDKEFAYLGDQSRFSKNIVIKSKTGDITSVTAISSSGDTVKINNVKNSGKQYVARAIIDKLTGKTDIVLTLTVNVKGESPKTVQLGANRLLEQPVIKAPAGSTMEDYLKDKVGKKPTIDVEIPKIPKLPSYAKLKVYLVSESDRDKQSYLGDEYSPNEHPRFSNVTAKKEVSTGRLDPSTNKTIVTITESDYEKALGKGELYALTIIEVGDAINHNPGTRASKFSEGVQVGPKVNLADIKQAAKGELAKAAAEETKAINADKSLTTAKRNEKLQEVATKKTEGEQAIDATTVDDADKVEAAKNDALGKINNVHTTGDLNSVKQAAKAELATAAAEEKAEIAGDKSLTAAQRAEKEKAVDDTKAAEEAKITAADDADKVEAAKTAGVTAIKAVHTVGSLDDVKAVAKALPNTGTVKSTLAIPVAITSALLSLGLVGGRRRKEDEEV